MTFREEIDQLRRDAEDVRDSAAFGRFRTRRLFRLIDQAEANMVKARNQGLRQWIRKER